jgi:hypothetical protein
MLRALRSVPAIYPKETGVANGSPMIKIRVAVVRTMPSPSGADQARLASTLSVNTPFSLPHVGRLILRESMTRSAFCSGQSKRSPLQKLQQLKGLFVTGQTDGASVLGL